MVLVVLVVLAVRRVILWIWTKGVEGSGQETGMNRLEVDDDKRNWKIRWKGDLQSEGNGAGRILTRCIKCIALLFDFSVSGFGFQRRVVMVSEAQHGVQRRSMALNGGWVENSILGIAGMALMCINNRYQLILGSHFHG